MDRVTPVALDLLAEDGPARLVKKRSTTVVDSMCS